LTALENARWWLHRRFHPIPVPYRSKKPALKKWPSLRLKEAELPRYFNGEAQNIGIILGDEDGSADVDVDCNEAIVAAAMLLPETNLVFGRPSKRASHYIYRVDPPIPSLKFIDPIRPDNDESTIIELRCRKKDGKTGFQTVVPESVHESDEPIRFEPGRDGHPASVAAKALADAVARVAAASLLSRYWPKPRAGRNDAFLAMAGTLARAYWSVEGAIDFNSAIYRVLWGSHADRCACISEVRATFEKHAVGAETTGIPKLNSLIDERIVKIALKWLGIDTRQPAADSRAQSSAPMTTAEVSGQDSVSRKFSGHLRIQINNKELRDLSAATLAALHAANRPPYLFSRAGVVARVDQLSPLKWTDEEGTEHTTPGRQVIVLVSDTHLRGEMTRCADYFKASRRGKQIIETAVYPPLDIARDLLSRPMGELNFPALESLAENPFIRPDGDVVCKPGYDAITRTFYAPTTDLQGFDVPDRPTADDVDAARVLIEEAIGEFPYVDQASRANAFALFITPEVRHAIDGCVPIGLCEAPQAGTGKTLLAKIVSMKATGGPAAMKPAPTHEEEWRKEIMSILVAGHPIVILDNVDHALRSSSLASVVTSTSWTDRPLGQTAMLTLTQRTVFIVTGNNLSVQVDLPRRCFKIRMDAKRSEPWLGREFRQPHLEKWALKNRGRLLGAVLTLARAWFTAGCPNPATPILGGFEEWCRIVGGILEHAGIEGFLGNLDEFYRDADPSFPQWVAFLSGLLVLMPKGRFKSADVLPLLREDAAFRATLPDELGEHDSPSFQKRLGKALQKRAGRRHGDRVLRVVNAGSNQGVTVWCIQTDES
jgi:hypothetical protein